MSLTTINMGNNDESSEMSAELRRGYFGRKKLFVHQWRLLRSTLINSIPTYICITNYKCTWTNEVMDCFEKLQSRLNVMDAMTEEMLRKRFVVNNKYCIIKSTFFYHIDRHRSIAAVGGGNFVPSGTIPQKKKICCS